MHTSFREFTKRVGWIFILLCLVAAVPQLQAQVISSGTNPNGMYWCGDGYRAKSVAVHELGKTLANVSGIVVLDCHGSDGGGGWKIFTCPAGSPYSYCVRAYNDGMGNHIELGVLEFNSTTDPNAQYGGCAAGSGYRTKSSVILEARKQLRDINGIVVTKCTKADGPGGTKEVPCSRKNHFYAACYRNNDDGVGNHVELGLVNRWGFPDAIGQYGGVGTGSGMGYRSKSVLVTEVGKKLDKVLSIVPMGGNSCRGSGGSQIVDCGYSGYPYTYCIVNNCDPVGNQIGVGVIERP